MTREIKVKDTGNSHFEFDLSIGDLVDSTSWVVTEIDAKEEIFLYYTKHKSLVEIGSIVSDVGIGQLQDNGIKVIFEV